MINAASYSIAKGTGAVISRRIGSTFSRMLMLMATSPDAWRGAVLAVWNHPVVGGGSDGAPALALLGTIAWLLGSLAAAVAVRRAGHSWLPIVYLVVSALGLFVFRTHAWPGGPVTFGALAMAAASLEWEPDRSGC
jgi:hypothetical protein